MLWLDLGEYSGPSRFHTFVMYAVARFKQRGHEAAYRTYVTESLRNIPQGKYIRTPYVEAIRPREEIDVKQISAHVRARLEAMNEPT